MENILLPPISFTISYPSYPVELYIGHHLLQGELLGSLCKKYGRQSVIITDSHVKGLYGSALAKKLEAQLFEVLRGEQAKTRAVKEFIEDQLIQSGYSRDTVIVAIGGGTVTDLAGYLASTYLRGVPLILVPTTLLGMVDASIGGKTAVDTCQGKNMIGTIYHPKAIIVDTETLKTLPENEMANGLAEIVKMGLIRDPDILLSNFLEEMITRAVKAKIEVVVQDPFEKGLRRILNFGHTIGHGLETISSFTISHGEAVAIGCVTESYLSARLGYLPKEQLLQIEKLYQEKFSFLKLPKNYERKELLKALAFDKKRSIEGVRFVLIDNIGSPIFFEGEYCSVVVKEDLTEALAYMEQRYG